MADDFAKALEVLPKDHHKIVACAGEDRSHAQAYGESHNITYVFDSFQELASCPDVDVVYVALPCALHCDICHLMLDHGKHVLCEKPLSMSEPQVFELLKKAREKKLFLMEGMWPRCVPAYHFLRHQILRNSYGQIYNVYCSLGLPMSRKTLATHGGVTRNFGVYGLQLALWVYREIPQSISTSGTISDGDIDVEANIELTFSKGRKARIVLSAEQRLANEAHIRGTKSNIKISNYWCPTRILDSQKEEYLFPLPDAQTMTHYHNRIGMCYEAEEVRNCLLCGRHQSDLFNHNESLLMANLIDSIQTVLQEGTERTDAMENAQSKQSACSQSCGG